MQSLLSQSIFRRWDEQVTESGCWIQKEASRGTNREWQRGIMAERTILGSATPQSLLDTVMFYCGLYFALRSGEEHRQLRNSPCQIEIVKHPNERPCLKYTEDISKNHAGGLKGRRVTPKVVLHHANLNNPEHCFVRLFQQYRQLCPVDAPADAFYLKPSKFQSGPYNSGEHSRSSVQVSRPSRLQNKPLC